MISNGSPPAEGTSPTLKEEEGAAKGAVTPSPAAEEPRDPRIGTTVGKYLIRRRLGRGGMGVVYEAEDSSLQRLVAVKFLAKERLTRPEVVERFLREAKVAARLQHPNIITIHDVAREENVCYIVMEMLHPGSAGSRLKVGPYNWMVATRIVADCCSALQVAHNAGIVHRDIKPDNILFTDSGMVKLIDFGLVKLMQDDLNLTQSGAVCGTPLYMSPEQALRQKVDPRSDLYSLGATYYSLLTGWPPFLGFNVVQILMQHVRLATPDPRLLIPNIPEGCVRVIMRAMAKKPSQRYQSAAAMRSDLENLLLGKSQPSQSIFILDTDAPAAVARPPLVAAGEMSLSGESASNPLQTRPDLIKTLVVELTQPLAPAEGPSRRKLLLAAPIALAALGTGGFLALRQLRGGHPRVAPPSALPIAPPAPIKVGVLHSLSGPMAVSERPLADASLLAIEELNREGGLLGRQIEPILLDGKSEVVTDAAFALAAERLLSKDNVAALFGGYGSASRRIIRTAVEKHKGLLFYPGQYEGLEESESIIYTGATPNQFALPALHWCLEHLHAKRFYFVGTDGLRARAISAIIGDSLKQLGGELVGEDFELVGEFQFGAVLKKIEHAKPHMILNMLVADSIISFFRALLAAPSKIVALPVLSFSLSENELAQLGTFSLTGQYVARTRFPGQSLSPSTGLAQSFARRYGSHRPLSEDMEAAYYGVRLWAAAVKRAGSTDVEAVRQALKQQEYSLPGARLKVDPRNQHLWKVFELGQIGRENRIEPLPTGDEPIAPVAFPGQRSRADWEQFSEALHQKWGDNWANPLKPHSRKGK